MGHVFACQNELGRLCDEPVYRNDIALRLEAAGLGPVAKEVPVTVRHRDFVKTYRLDVVVQNSFVAELKAVPTLLNEHDGQLLNYLLILDVPHGKLVNLRPPSVEYRAVNAVVSAADRRRFRLLTKYWRRQGTRCREMVDIIEELLTAWGAFLDCRLYEEALIHFLGGASLVLRRVPLTRAGRSLGSQSLALLTEEVGFRLTALPPFVPIPLSDRLLREVPCWAGQFHAHRLSRSMNTARPGPWQHLETRAGGRPKGLRNSRPLVKFGPPWCDNK